jgi:hypothetical protein
MWLFTTDGFFSAVAHRTDAGTVIVRSRVANDARRLVEAAGAGDVIETSDSDYRFRVHLPRQTWATYVAAAAAAIDYHNFKDAVAARAGADRAHTYGQVWSVMQGLQQRQLGAAMQPPTKY